MVSAAAGALAMSAALGIVPAPASAAEQEARVLILNTADTYLPGHRVIENAMRASLDSDTTRQVAYFFESIDAYRFSMEALEPELLALFSKKYKALPIDVVVAVSRPAIEFFGRYGKQLWPGARVVYNAFSAEYGGRVALPPNVGGVVSYQDVAGTIALARRLRPNPRRIVVVSGASEVERSAAQLAANALSTSANQAPVEFLSGLPLQELLARVADEPADAIIIYLTQYRDRDGRPYTPREVLRAISKISVAPIYGTYETYVGFGVAAGQMESYEEEGRLIAEQVLAALAGRPFDPSHALLKTGHRHQATGRVGDGKEHADKQQRGKRCDQRRIEPAVRFSCGGRQQPVEPMSDERSGRRSQHEAILGAGELRQGRDEKASAAALQHRCITGELAVQRKARAGEPQQRMKPQQALREFVDQPQQVVAPPGMHDLVQEHCVQLALAQQVLDPQGQADVAAQDALDRRSLTAGGEVHRHALHAESGRVARPPAAVRSPFAADAYQKTQQHEERARDPQGA
jgi:hypothetical protein